MSSKVQELLQQGLKRCGKCKEIKPVTEFSKSKSKSTGYNSFCKECMREYSNRYYKDNLDELQAKKKQWYYDNREVVLEKQRPLLEQQKTKRRLNSALRLWRDAQVRVWEEFERRNADMRFRQVFDTPIEELDDCDQIARLKDLFVYSADGNLYWRYLGAPGKGTDRDMMNPIGEGLTNRAYYKNVRIDGQDFPVHRAVFAIHNGYFPGDGMHVDHINGDHWDNRIENLQCVPGWFNAFKGESKPGKSDLSGINGTCNGKWYSSFTWNGKLYRGKSRRTRLEALMDWCFDAGELIYKSGWKAPQFDHRFALVERAISLYYK